MGKISDALERRDKENLLKIDTSIREQPIKLNHGKPKTGGITGGRFVEGTNEKLVVLSDPESADAEGFRFLRSQISQGRDGERPGTIMVTSAFPGEGKTFVACNLAASIAAGSGEQVLLIDGDLKKPSVHQILGGYRTEGLYEYLDRKKELNDLIFGTKIQGLSMLSAGKSSVRPSESGSSSGMERFMKEVKQRFRDRVVIIDTAPSNVSAGTRVIAKYVDAIVFVIMAEKWPRQEIQKSMESLGKDKILGVIFNGYMQANRNYRKYYDRYYGKK
jgi:protein-tyrosine kinase